MLPIYFLIPRICVTTAWYYYVWLFIYIICLNVSIKIIQLLSLFSRGGNSRRNSRLTRYLRFDLWSQHAGPLLHGSDLYFSPDLTPGDIPFHTASHSFPFCPFVGIHRCPFNLSSQLSTADLFPKIRWPSRGSRVGRLTRLNGSRITDFKGKSSINCPDKGALPNETDPVSPSILSCSVSISLPSYFFAFPHRRLWHISRRSQSYGTLWTVWMLEGDGCNKFLRREFELKFVLIDEDIAGITINWTEVVFDN